MNDAFFKIEGLRTDAAEMTVASGPVVEHFNVIEDILPGHITCYIYVFPEPFFFQRTEERFGHRIIPAVAAKWHDSAVMGGVV